MKAQKEERYWSRFAHSYDRDGEYIVGNPILRAFFEEPVTVQARVERIDFLKHTVTLVPLSEG